MYRIGFVGHTPEYAMQDIELQKSLARRTVDLIQHQYGEDLIINVAGDTGMAEYIADACVALGVKYHLFLPFPPQYMEMLWYPDQYRKLMNNFNAAWATTVTRAEYDKADELESRMKSYRSLVDYSQFVICAWNGMKQGTTFESVRYGLEKNKLMLNAHKELKMITNEDLVKRR